MKNKLALRVKYNAKIKEIQNRFAVKTFKKTVMFRDEKNQEIQDRFKVKTFFLENTTLKEQK